MAQGRVIVLIAVLTSTLTLNGSAQAPSAGGTASLFEAVSIKESSGTRVPIQWQGARFLAGEIPLSTLLVAAYEIPFYQVADLPDWVRTVRYEINAVASRAPAPSEQSVSSCAARGAIPDRGPDRNEGTPDLRHRDGPAGRPPGTRAWRDTSPTGRGWPVCSTSSGHLVDHQEG